MMEEQFAWGFNYIRRTYLIDAPSNHTPTASCDGVHYPGPCLAFPALGVVARPEFLGWQP